MDSEVGIESGHSNGKHKDINNNNKEYQASADFSIPFSSSKIQAASLWKSIHKKRFAEIEPESNSESAARVVVHMEPDKGYAWVVLVCSFVNLGFSLGSLNSIGVFQTYYLKRMFVHVEAEKLAWITTSCTVVTLGAGLFASWVSSKLGLRYTAVTGSVFAAAGLLFASFSTQIWQLVLSQGIIFGAGAALLINTSLTAPALWFDRRRSLAMGLVASGGGFGALILIPMMTKLLETTLISWCFRVLSAVYVAISLPCSLLTRPRGEYSPIPKIVDVRMLRDPAVLWLCLMGFFVEAGTGVVILYFPASLVDLGASLSLATNLIMVFSAFSTVSRFVSGYISHRFDPVSMLIFNNLTSAISFMAMWYVSKSLGFSMAFYVVFGIFSVPFFALQPIIVSMHYKAELISMVNGLAYLFMGLSILIAAPLIAYVFQTAGKRSIYSQIIIIGFACFFAAFGCSIALKYYLNKRPRQQ